MNIQCLPHEYKRNVFVILIDEEVFREVHTSVFGKHPRLPKTIDAKDSLQEQFSLFEKKCVRNFVLRSLAKRNYSTFELTKLLDDRLVSQESISAIIEEIKIEGIVNDQDWIQSFISRSLKKEGPKAISLKLKAKGVPEELILKALSQQESQAPQEGRIRHLLETKYRNRDLTSFKERQKVIASLLRKGFDLEEIYQAVKPE